MSQPKRWSIRIFFAHEMRSARDGRRKGKQEIKILSLPHFAHEINGEIRGFVRSCDLCSKGSFLFCEKSRWID